MLKVKLLTSSGDLVTTGEIIPFNAQPDVLLWGSRFFKFKEINFLTGELTYTEAFVFALVSV